MQKRPLPITVISWFLIISSVFSIFSVFLTLNNPVVVEILAQSPVPISIQYAMMALTIIILFASAILMLRGNILGRNMYLIFSVISIIYSLLTSPLIKMQIPSIILFFVIAFFLFRPNAKHFFANNNSSGLNNA